MGIASASLHSASFPIQRRANFALIADLEKPGTVELIFTLKWKGEPKWSSKMELTVEGVDKGAVVPVSGPLAAFESAGKLELDLEIDGKTQTLQEWSMLGPDES